MQCSVQMLCADSGMAAQQTKAGQSHWRNMPLHWSGAGLLPAARLRQWDWPRPKPLPGEVDGDSGWSFIYSANMRQTR